MAIIILNSDYAKECYDHLVRVHCKDDDLENVSSRQIARFMDSELDRIFDVIDIEDTSILDDDELIVYNFLIMMINQYKALGIIIRIYLLDRFGNFLIQTEEF